MTLLKAMHAPLGSSINVHTVRFRHCTSMQPSNDAHQDNLINIWVNIEIWDRSITLEIYQQSYTKYLFLLFNNNTTHALQTRN